MIWLKWLWYDRYYRKHASPHMAVLDKERFYQHSKIARAFHVPLQITLQTGPSMDEVGQEMLSQLLAMKGKRGLQEAIEAENFDVQLRALGVWDITQREELDRIAYNMAKSSNMSLEEARAWILHEVAAGRLSSEGAE